jgi:hypothetical protein
MFKKLIPIYVQRYCFTVGVFCVTNIKSLQLLHFPKKGRYTLDMIIHASSWSNAASDHALGTSVTLPLLLI